MSDEGFEIEVMFSEDESGVWAEISKGGQTIELHVDELRAIFDHAQQCVEDLSAEEMQ